MIRRVCEYAAGFVPAASIRQFGVALGLAASAFLLPVEGIAQSTSTYTYPGTTSQTQFTVGNINGQSVSVSVSYYANDGTLTQSTMLIQPGRQVRFSGESLEIVSFRGTTVISAPLALAVSATATEIRSFEHLPSANAGTDLVIPFSGHSGTSTTVSVFNPSSDLSASVRLVTVDESGLATGFQTLSVGPHQTVHHQIAVDSSLGTRYTMVRSGSILLPGQPVMAMASVGNFPPPSGVAGVRTDRIYVAGRPLLAQGSAVSIPLAISGGDFFTAVQIINNQNTPQDVVVTALDSTGSPISGSSNPVTVQIVGRGAVSETLSTLVGFDSSDQKIGSVRVEGADRLTVGLAIGNISQASLALIPPRTAPADRFVYHRRRIGRDFYLGLNLTNPSTGAANLDLAFVLDDGTTVSTATFAVPASSQVTTALSAIMPEAQGNGYLFVRSSVPIVADGFEGASDNSVLSPLRALPAGGDYAPAPVTQSLVSGTVFAGGVGLQDVSILLSGPLSQTTLTDRVGTFVFPDLPAGTYILTTQSIGYAMTPADRTVVVTDGSSQRVSFTAALVQPIIETFSPSEVPVGSSNTQIVVEGGPFIRTSRVFFETTALQTTFIDSGEIRAAVPSTLLSLPSEVDLFVRSSDPSGQIIDSPIVRFRVGTAPPVITGLGGHPDPLVAGSQSFNLTVTGTGFFPGVRAYADGVPQATTFVSDTELRVVVSAEAIANGGFVAITVLNPGPTIQSVPVFLPVVALPPTIAFIAPDGAAVRLEPDLPPLAVEVHGDGFLDGAVVLIDGSAVATIYVSANLLTATIPASVLAQSGILLVQVRNPEPTLADSFGVAFTLTTPAPVLTSVNGTAVFGGRTGEVQNVPLLLNGENFSADSIAWARAPCDTDLTDDTDDANTFKALSTTRLTSRIMLINLRVACAGNYAVQVRSPQPGGGVSGTLNVNVRN